MQYVYYILQMFLFIIRIIYITIKYSTYLLYLLVCWYIQSFRLLLS